MQAVDTWVPTWHPRSHTSKHLSFVSFATRAGSTGVYQTSYHPHHSYVNWPFFCSLLGLLILYGLESMWRSLLQSSRWL
jgi:hypothetical protein